MELASWIEIAKTFGITACILGCFMFGTWQVIRWVGQEMAIPLRERFLLRLEMFLAQLSDTMSKIDRNVDAMTDNMQEQTVSLKQIEQYVKENKDLLGSTKSFAHSKGNQ